MENPLCDDEHLAATQQVDDRVLKDVVGYVEVRTTNDNRSEAVRRELQLLGATVVKKFTNDVTHVVFKEGSNRTKTKAQKKGVHFVSVLWVDCCKQNQEHVSERMYPAIVPKQKGSNLFIAKLKKAKSMQPRDFEEEVSRSAERVSRKKRRIEALDRLQSAGNTPHRSPRTPVILVQDTQPRSPEDEFCLTPIRLTIPDTPPSMREKMKKLNIGREGSYNEAEPDGRKFSSKEFIFDKQSLQRNLFKSSGASFDQLTSFDSPGANSVFTSEDDTKDTTDNTSDLSDDNNTELDCEEENPVLTDKADMTGKCKKGPIHFSPIAENKNEDTFQASEGESDTSVTEDILNIADKINATMNKKKTALDDSVNLDSGDIVASSTVIEEQQSSHDNVLDDKFNSPCGTGNLRNESSSKNVYMSPFPKKEYKKTYVSDKRNHKSEVAFTEKNTRRKSRRISLQKAVIQTQNDNVHTSFDGEDNETSVSVGAKQVTNQNAAGNKEPAAVSPEQTGTKPVPQTKYSKDKNVLESNKIMFDSSNKITPELEKEIESEDTRMHTLQSEMKNKDTAADKNQDVNETHAKPQVSRRRTHNDIENRTLKKKSMPKRKLLSLTDLNEPHSVLVEPDKCSEVKRPELVENKPKGKGSRKEKGNMSKSSEDDCSSDDRKRCFDSVAVSDKDRKQSIEPEIIKHGTDSGKTINSHNINESKNGRSKSGRKRQLVLSNSIDKLINNSVAVQNQVSETFTETKNRGRKRGKNINKSGLDSESPAKQPKSDSTATQSKSEKVGKELVKVNDTVMKDKDSDVSTCMKSQLQDITTQLNLTANNSVTASLKDGTLSLSMSAVYNTDSTMQSFLVSQRKSIDEFNLSQRNKNKEKTKQFVKAVKKDRKDIYKSSSDSDNSVSGRSRKNYRRSLVMTSLHSHEQDVVISVVKKLGGFVITENVNETTTHVICGEPRRTLNILQCLARGVWLLNKSWVIKSLEAGAWIPEEEFECVHFFPACKVARLEKESSSGCYKQQLFSDVGPVYISGRSSPPREQLKQLIKLCGGQVTGVLNRASVYVGSDLHPNLTCLKTQWILDCISQHRLLSMEKYSLDRPKREASPVY